MNAARQDYEDEAGAFKIGVFDSGLLDDGGDDESGLKDDDDEDEDEDDEDDEDGEGKGKRGKKKNDRKKKQRVKRTFINMGEDSTVPGHEDMFQLGYDEITSTGHHYLEQHREFRHYARLAAWELPLLTSEYCSGGLGTKC